MREHNRKISKWVGVGMRDRGELRRAATQPVAVRGGTGISTSTKTKGRILNTRQQSLNLVPTLLRPDATTLLKGQLILRRRAIHTRTC